ncbi:MAG: hypothetical protein ACLFTK_03180 [Anaerolineales bacterium]
MRIWFSVILLGCWLLHSPATAQDTPDDDRLSYGDTVEGALEADNYRQLYQFQGRAGEIITAEMRTSQGDLDPVLVLVDASGTGLAISDDDGPGRAAALSSVRLPADGAYFLIATRYGHAHGLTTGSYILSLERLGTATPAGATLQYGDSVIGQINTTAPQIVYTFQGQRGDVINLRLTRTSGNLDALLDLANADGQILRTGDDDPSAQGTLDAAILNYTLPETGFYLIVATRYGREAGTTQGSYRLALDSVPIEVRGRSPLNAILLDYDMQLTGSLGAEVPQRFYTFSGTRGDVIDIQMARTFGNLHMVIILLDSELNELRRAEGGAIRDLALDPYALPADSVYYIMAARAGFSEGSTAGDYTLALTGRPGLDAGAAQEVLYGEEYTGFISAALPAENYQFQGTAGDVVTLRMSVTSGDLVPLMTLYQGDKQITFDVGEGGNAALITLTLEASGVYRIETSRIDRAAGDTSGGYLLRVQGR